ncbi:vWA domain-containing protein [Haloarcula sp. H-GB5]
MLLDASGSMKGEDPDRLAKDAAQRFTGSLLETDRAAVIEFDNFGRVKQPLTSNHTAVNRSIRDVDYEGGNGGTDFASISAANEHFAEQSSPDRSKIIIFLTDGKSKYSDGVTEAKQAAEQNITIYPIGFGGATRDQLSAIANETGGEVNFVDDAEGLPTVFSRVANTTTKINDTDGDGLSDEMEREGFILGGPDGARVTTDPGTTDTDGDGLSDSREIGQYAEVKHRGETASYYNHVSNPRQIDTDGDNLTDAEEVTGWEVQRTQSANASKGYLNVSRPDPSKRLLRSYLRSLYRGEAASYQDPLTRGTGSDSSKALAIAIAEETDIDVSTLNETGHGPSPDRSYLTNTTVTSDPLRSDTDRDGLTDNVEHLRGTDPDRADTDGDGISDQAEFTNGTAPVLFDHRAPTVTIESIRTRRVKDTTKVVVRRQGTTKTVSLDNFEVTTSRTSGSIIVPKYRYSVRLRAHDPSGVSKLVVEPDCQYLARRAGSSLSSLPQSACQVDGETIRFDNETTTSYRRVEFTVRTPVDKAGVFAFQELGQSFESTPVAVTAVDSNGNSRSSDYTSPGAIPELAETVADNPATGEFTEDKVIEEIAYRSGGVWGVRQSALDMSYFLSHPWTAVTGLKDIERLPDAALRAPETLPSAARNLQDRQNPFDRQTETENYKLYGQSWLVGYGTGIAGSELTIGLATGGGSTVSKAAKLRKVTDTLGDAGRAARGWTFHRSVKMASTISKGSDIGPTGARRALGRVVIPERVRHAQRLNSPRWTRVIESLPERTSGLSRTERVSRTMRRTGDDGRQLMLDLHNSGNQQALETFIDMDDTPGSQRALVRAYRENPDVSKQDVGEALGRYHELDADSQADFKEVVDRTGSDAVEFAARSDSDTFDAVFGACGRRSLSLGSAGGLRSDRYHSVAGPSTALIQSGDGCLPDDVENEFQAAVVDIDRDDVNVGAAREAISDLDRNAQDAATDLIDREGADGVRLINDADSLVDDLGLDNSDAGNLVEAYKVSSQVSEGPITDARELQGVLDELESRDGFDDLDDVVKSASRQESGFKGPAGEGYVGKALDDRDGIDAGNGDIEFEQEITSADIEKEHTARIASLVERNRKFKDVSSSGSDVDIDSNTDVEVNGQTLDGPAIESKNLAPSNDKFVREIEWTKLQKKLRTHAVAGEDEIIVMMDQDYINVEANRIGGSGSSREILGDALESDIENTLSNELGIEKDVTVEVTSYSDL